MINAIAVASAAPCSTIAMAQILFPDPPPTQHALSHALRTRLESRKKGQQRHSLLFFARRQVRVAIATLDLFKLTNGKLSGGGAKRGGEEGFHCPLRAWRRRRAGGGGMVGNGGPIWALPFCS